MEAKIWHKRYIKVLPKKLLVSTFQELSRIALGISDSKYVKKINEFNKSHFYNYCCEVYDEIQRRDFEKGEIQVIDEWAKNIYNSISDEEKQIGASISFDELFELPISFMNNRMFVQHYYALQEMLDLDLISDEEFNLIQQTYNAYYY